jgi:hypothetical protein
MAQGRRWRGQLGTATATAADVAATSSRNSVTQHFDLLLQREERLRHGTQLVALTQHFDLLLQREERLPHGTQLVATLLGGCAGVGKGTSRHLWSRGQHSTKLHEAPDGASSRTLRNASRHVAGRLPETRSDHYLSLRKSGRLSVTRKCG